MIPRGINIEIGIEEKMMVVDDWFRLDYNYTYIHLADYHDICLKWESLNQIHFMICLWYVYDISIYFSYLSTNTPISHPMKYIMWGENGISMVSSLSYTRTNSLLSLLINWGYNPLTNFHWATKVNINMWFRGIRVTGDIMGYRMHNMQFGYVCQ